jgi:hypothetical protein
MVEERALPKRASDEHAVPDARIIATPSPEAWTVIVEQCMAQLDDRDRDLPEERLAWLATRLHEFLGLRAWWVVAAFDRDLATVASSGHVPVHTVLERDDDATLVIDGCDPDAQEWRLVLQREPGGYDLRLARPLVTALVYAALGFPRAPAASGVRWPARRLLGTTA